MAPATNIIAVARLENVAFWASSNSYRRCSMDVDMVCFMLTPARFHDDTTLLGFEPPAADSCRHDSFDHTSAELRHGGADFQVKSASRSRFNGVRRAAVLAESRCRSFGHPIKWVFRFSQSRPGRGVQVMRKQHG